MKIRLTGGNIRNGHFYLERNSEIFPSDAWGGSNKSEAGEPITVLFQGTDEKVSTDIDSEKSFFRNARGQSKRFLIFHELTENDEIAVEARGPREFIVSAIPAKSTMPPTVTPRGNMVPARAEVTVNRIIRDTTVTSHIKQLYEYKCQVCQISIETRAGPYSEGAHIQPLGSPHQGPDIPENILSLCPNHHVMLDLGYLSVNDDLSLNGFDGLLFVHKSHIIGQQYIRYHRDA